MSQQTNAAAIVGGCAPADRWRSIAEYVIDPQRVKRTRTPADGPVGGDEPGRPNLWAKPRGFDPDNDVVEAQPFFAHFVHQAVARAGLRDRIPELCLRWLAQIERGGTAFEEFWAAPMGTASRCHASVGDADIRPDHPRSGGFVLRRRATAAASSHPRFAGLTSLAGRVPTPFGLDRARPDAGRGSVVVPDGVIAQVPSARGGQVELKAGKHSVSL